MALDRSPSELIKSSCLRVFVRPPEWFSCILYWKESSIKPGRILYGRLYGRRIGEQLADCVSKACAKCMMENVGYISSRRPSRSCVTTHPSAITWHRLIERQHCSYREGMAFLEKVKVNSLPLVVVIDFLARSRTYNLVPGYPSSTDISTKG